MNYVLTRTNRGAVTLFSELHANMLIYNPDDLCTSFLGP